MEITEQQQDDDRSITRLQNRALRSVVRGLRRKLERVESKTDVLFAALCETDKEAEHAMGELWGSGEFDCGPQDYDWIVERCLAAIREYNERHTNPVTGRIELVSTRLQGVDCVFCEDGTEHIHL